MVRVLHSGLMVTPPAGIVKQMEWEQQAAKALNLPWRSVLYCRNSASINSEVIVSSPERTRRRSGLIGWAELRQAYYQWLEAQALDYDVIALRHTPSDPLQARFLRANGRKVFLVHHGKEIPEFLAFPKTLKTFVKCAIEYHCGRVSLNRARGLIAVTQEILDYEADRVPCRDFNSLKYIYPNGIYCDDDLPLARDNRGEIPELLFIASHFTSWQGLDLLLNQMSSISDDFILHLVGNVDDRDAQTAAKDPRVKTHGNLQKKDIDDLSSRCWVGLSSFALYRQGLTHACSLKVREYLNNGLPVYSGHLDVFPEDFRYFKFGSPSFKDILIFAKEMRLANRNIVSSAAMPYISKKILLAGLYQRLASA